jgi:tagatose-6-phosphate ketose/aldose isomerase
MTHTTSETATGREIDQQPAVWRQVAASMADRSDALREFLDPVLARSDLRVVLTGAGTSAFAGRILAPALAGRLGRRVEAVPTTDIVSNPREVFAEDVPTLLVSFARSGDSPESIAATTLAQQCLTAVHQLIVTCNADGALARTHGSAAGSEVLLMPAATNDTGFAMTSSFTSMLLATWLALTGGAGGDDAVERLAQVAEQLLADPAVVDDLAGRGYERVVYLGSGALAGLAQESALKVLELTAGRVVSYHDSSLGFRHGPKAVLTDRTLAVVYRSGDPYTAQYDDDISAELRAALGDRNVLVVRADGDAAGHSPVVGPHGLDGLADVFLAAAYVVVAQQLALRMSLALGLTPDNPFPDGTVNRVVQGVTLHALPPR